MTSVSLDAVHVMVDVYFVTTVHLIAGVHTVCDIRILHNMYISFYAYILHQVCCYVRGFGLFSMNKEEEGKEECWR